MGSEVGNTTTLKERWLSGITLSLAIMEVGEMRSFENLNKIDNVFSSSEIEDVRVAASTLLETTSWMDWWFYADKSLAMWDTNERAKVKYLFMAIATTQLPVDKTASTIWANTLLKHCSSSSSVAQKIGLLRNSFSRWGSGCLTERFLFFYPSLFGYCSSAADFRLKLFDKNLRA